MFSDGFLPDAHANSAAPQTGKSMPIGNATDALIQISGTATSFTIVFEESLDGTNFSPIEGTNRGDSSIVASSTSLKNSSWEFDVSLSKYIRANLTSVSGGYINVKINTVYDE